MNNIIKQIDLLCSKNNNIAYQALKTLQSESKKTNLVYDYIDKFIDMIDSDNSYVRTRSLVLIAFNAKWDVDNRIDKIIDRYLQHITDEKPITSRQCIKMLPMIAKYKPALKTNILSALQNADISFYADSMQPLVYRDMQETLKKINEGN